MNPARDDTERTVLQWRCQEEAACRDVFRAAQHELDEVRGRLAAIDEAIADSADAARASMMSNDPQKMRSRNQRVWSLRLERSRMVAELAGAKLQLAEARKGLMHAIQERTHVGLIEATRAAATEQARETIRLEAQ